MNVLGKIVYNQANFVSGYLWFTIGTFAGALALLVPSSWRRQIFTESGQDNPRSRFWYFVNRFISGVGSFLIFYAISLTHPAIVDAISGVRYVIIFLTALLLTKLRPMWLTEQFRGWECFTKAVATGLVVAGLVFVGMSSENSGSPTAGTGDEGGSPAANCFGMRLVVTSEGRAVLIHGGCYSNPGLLRREIIAFLPCASNFLPTRAAEAVDSIE